MRYVVDGSAVVVPARVAAILAAELHLERRRSAWRGRDVEVDEVCSDWLVVARQHNQALFRANGPVVDDVTEQPSECDEWTTHRVSQQFKITTSAVRIARRRGRLRGVRRGNRWVFTTEEVQRWRNQLPAR